MKQNIKCYYFEELNFSTGLFDETVDVTYVLYLEGSDRIKSVITQIYKYIPTKKIYIVHNKGFMKCPKKNVTTPLSDCIESHHQAYIHAYNNKYNNILILEDDFIFSNKLKDKKVTYNINTFLKKFNNTSFTYFLGALPHIVSIYERYTYNVHMAGGAHSYIISKKCRNRFLSNNKIEPMSRLFSLEHYLISNASNAFMYYIPLAYQLCSETESQKSWKKDCKNIMDYLYNIRVYLYIKYLKLLKLDKMVEPGFSIFYFISKMFFYLKVLIITIIIYNLLFIII